MFCPKCGKQIDDDSIFCLYCGAKIVKHNEKVEIKNNTNNLEKTENKHTVWKIFAVFAMLFALIAIIVAIIYNTKELTACSNDIYVNNNFDFTKEISCIIKPKKDIKDLEIKISFFNNLDKMITYRIEKIGNVNKNIEYKFVLPLSEFYSNTLSTFSYYNVEVISGTVKYY